MSVLIVGVALFAELTNTLDVMRLFVSVAVPSVVVNPPVALVALPSAVTTPVPVVVVAGAAPAPPPNTIAFAANAADDAHVLALEK